MLDFLRIAWRSTKKEGYEVYPKFVLGRKSSDLMIRGGDFYAVWIEERGLWSTDENDVVQMVDKELDKFAENHKEELGENVRIMYMWDSGSGMIDSWHKYCQRQMRDSFHMLDEKIIFSNTTTP